VADEVPVCDDRVKTGLTSLVSRQLTDGPKANALERAVLAFDSFKRGISIRTWTPTSALAGSTVHSYLMTIGATGLAPSRYDDGAIVVYSFLCISFRRQLAQ
jgi:hypothetical protein